MKFQLVVAWRMIQAEPGSGRGEWGERRGGVRVDYQIVDTGGNPGGAHEWWRSRSARGEGDWGRCRRGVSGRVMVEAMDCSRRGYWTDVAARGEKSWQANGEVGDWRASGGDEGLAWLGMDGGLLRSRGATARGGSAGARQEGMGRRSERRVATGRDTLGDDRGGGTGRRGVYRGGDSSGGVARAGCECGSRGESRQGWSGTAVCEVGLLQRQSGVGGR